MTLRVALCMHSPLAPLVTEHTLSVQGQAQTLQHTCACQHQLSIVDQTRPKTSKDSS